MTTHQDDGEGKLRGIRFSPQAALGYGQLGGDVSELEIDWELENPLTCPHCGIFRPRRAERDGVAVLDCADCGRELARSDGPWSEAEFREESP